MSKVKIKKQSTISRSTFTVGEVPPPPNTLYGMACGLIVRHFKEQFAQIISWTIGQ